MPQFNINGPGSPSFILTSEKIETALTYKPAKQEDVEALQTAVAKKAEKTDLDAYTTAKELESKLADKVDNSKLDDYTNNTELEKKLNEKVNKSDLENYTDTDTLNGLLDAKADADDLSNYATNQALQEAVLGKVDESVLTDYAKKSDIASAVRYKESVATLSDLQDKKATAQLGDLFNVAESDMNYVYNGSEFDALAPMVDLSGYALKTYVDDAVKGKADSSALNNYALSSALTEGLATKAEKTHSHTADQVSVDATSSTTLNGILKGNGTKIALAADGTDYMSPTKVGAAVNEVTKKYYTASLTQAGWKDNAQNVSLAAVSADTTAQCITVRPVAAGFEAYCEAGIYCSAQSAGTLSFKCKKAPATDISIEIAIEKMMKG